MASVLERFAKEPAEETESDELLAALLLAIPKGDGRWRHIEDAYAGLAREPRTRGQLKHRAKRLESSGDAIKTNAPRVARRMHSVICQGCLCPEATGQKYQLCSKCCAVRYCSEACQAAHWPEHKQSCKLWMQERERCAAAGRPLGTRASSYQTRTWLETCSDDARRGLDALAWSLQHKAPWGVPPGPSLFIVGPRKWRSLLGMFLPGSVMENVVGNVQVWVLPASKLEAFSAVCHRTPGLSGYDYKKQMDVLSRVDVDKGFVISVLPTKKTRLETDCVRTRYVVEPAVLAMTAPQVGDAGYGWFYEVPDFRGPGALFEIDTKKVASTQAQIELEKHHVASECILMTGDRVKIIGPNIIGLRDWMGKAGTVLCDADSDGHYTIKVDGEVDNRSFNSARLRRIPQAEIDSNSHSHTNSCPPCVAMASELVGSTGPSFDVPLVKRATELVDMERGTSSRSKRILWNEPWVCDTCCCQQPANIECTWWDSYAYVGEWAQCDQCTLGCRSPDPASQKQRCLMIQKLCHDLQGIGVA